MTGKQRSMIKYAVACAAASAFVPSAGAYTTATKSFQQNVGGYTGEFTRQFTSSFDTNANAGNGVAASGTQLFVDGYGAGSPDQQVFLQFNNLFGANAIPSGAFIIDATLTLTTGTSSNSQSGGPFGVGAVLVPWTATSTYNSLKPAGSPEDGLDVYRNAITRSVASYDHPTILYGGTNALESAATSATKGTSVYRYTANVAPLVQAWSSGARPNYGFTIHAGNPSGTTDGWQIKTGTHGTAADRPLLNITYTTAPVSTARFQQGANGYTGTTMSYLRDDNNTADGSTLNNGFLDGWHWNADPDAVSPDDHALVRFDNIFTSEGGQVPKTARIVKAYLKVTTSDVGNAQTQEPFEVRQMLTSWDTTTRYSDFSGLGPRPGTHESNDRSANYGMIPNSDVYFDVGAAVKSWQMGQPNYGFDIRATEDPDDPFNNPNGTDDGWSIYFTGAADISVRPELIVHYTVRLPGDANEDGRIDPDDYALTDRGFRMNRTGWENGDFNLDGVVDAADYLLLDTSFKTAGGQFDPGFLAMRESQFGQGYTAALMAAVPEPTTLSLLAAPLALAATRRRVRR
jgi:hypothetical protein